MKHWTLNDVPWDRFDSAKVDAEMLLVVKAACLVERNAADYVSYLHNVFGDDLAFRADIDRWGEEEVQHGDALGRWAELADPSFDYGRSFQMFRDGYSIPIDVDASVRGSRAGELVARCVVESGTSSLYSALRDATAEPVLKFICHKIAGDEFRHYKLFYDNMRRYQEQDRLSKARRLMVVIRRNSEVEDDELAYAYHCANTPEQPYDRRCAAKAYAARAIACYRQDHIRRAVGMMLKPAGMNPNGRLSGWLTRLSWSLMQRYARRAQAA